MIEFILGILVSWWFLGGLGLWLLLLSHWESDGWGLFFLILLAICIYLAFNIPANIILSIIALYIPIGIGWSIFRWKRHCKNTIKGVDFEKLGLYKKGLLLVKLKPEENTTKIVNWIFVWPFSFIETILGDIVDIVEDFVRERIIGVYNGISKKYLDQINRV